MKQLLSVSIVLLLATAPIRAADYVVEEMREEGTPNLPFLSRASNRSLEDFASSSQRKDIVAVASLVSFWRAARPTVRQRGRDRDQRPISLGKAVWCTQDSAPVYLGYEDSLPACSDSGQPPERVEYFLIAPVTLGPGRDLAIGKDPDYLWLIEER